MNKPKVLHDYDIESYEDELFNDVDFTAYDTRNKRNVIHAIARVLNISPKEITLEKNDNMSEPIDAEGFGFDWFDVFINGKRRETVWVTDGYVMNE